MALFFSLLLLTSLFGYFLLSSYYTKASFAPFFTISLIVSLLYISTWLGILNIAANILFLFGFFLVIVFLLRTKQSWQYCRYFLSQPAILFFLIMFIGMALLFRNATLIYWDEFSFWGVFAKHYFLTNRFILPADNLDNSGYPPGCSLFQYFFLKQMGFSVYALYLAQGTFMASGLATLFHYTNCRKWGTWIIAVITVYLISFIPNDGGFHSIYVDSALGITTAGILISYYFFSADTKRYSLLWLTPCIMTLCLIQDTGNMLALLTLGIILLDFVSKNFSLTRLLQWIGLIVITILTVISWHYYVAHANLAPSKIFDQKFSLIHSLQILKNLDQQHQLILQRFINAIFSYPISGNIPGSLLLHIFKKLPNQSIISASAFLWWIVLVALSILLYFQEGKLKQANQHKIRLLIFLILLPLGCILFLSGLLMTYLLVFTAGEALNLASYDRYTAIYIVFWALSVFALQLRAQPFSTAFLSKLSLLVIPFVCFISLPGATVKFFIVKEENMNPLYKTIETNLAGYQAIHSNQSIYVIWQGSSGMEARIARYILYPIKINAGCYNIGKYVELSHSDGCIDIDTPNKLRAALNHYDYLWIGHASPHFFTEYQLKNPKHPAAQFYQINSKTHEIVPVDLPTQ